MRANSDDTPNPLGELGAEQLAGLRRVDKILAPEDIAARVVQHITDD